MKFQIKCLTPGDWEICRSVRLKALADTPDAFGSTHEEEIGFLEEDWRKRFERSDCRTFVSLSNSSKPIGLVVGAPYQSDAGLFSMWVDPEMRRTGMGGELVDRVIAWSRENGFSRLLLDVADENLSAASLYKSKGFTRTGIVGNLPPPRDRITEHQRSLSLE